MMYLPSRFVQSLSPGTAILTCFGVGGRVGCSQQILLLLEVGDLRAIRGQPRRAFLPNDGGRTSLLLDQK